MVNSCLAPGKYKKWTAAARRVIIEIVKGYASFCPVAKTAEIFAERWTPLLIRELCLGASKFSELQQGLPRMSRTLLVARLRKLEMEGVVTRISQSERAGSEYRLTAAGEAFRPFIDAMSEWAQRWGAGRLQTDDVEPGQLVWALRRHADMTQLPTRRVVIQFEFRRLPENQRRSRLWWLVLHKSDIDVCQRNPGYDVDVMVDADLMAFTRVWLGYEGLGDARRNRLVVLSGAAKAIHVARAVLKLRDTPWIKDFDYSPRPTASRTAARSLA